MMLRQQLPAFSPLGPSHLVGAVVGSRHLESADRLVREDYHADGVLLCGSGTQALTLALREAVRRTRSTAVALPAFGCYDLASAAIGAEAQVHLYDVDPATLAPDTASLERLLRNGVRTAVVAPLYGMPVCWDELSQLAYTYGGLLIEDAAQGHGATWQEKPLGSWGELSVISFGRGKGWTSGGGGALLWRGGSVNLTLPPQQRRDVLAGFAKNLAQWSLGRPSLYRIPASIPQLGLGRTVYHPPRSPVALSGYCRRVLVRTREASLREAQRRRDVGARLHAAAQAAGLNPFVPPPGSQAGYLRFPLRVRAADGWLRGVRAEALGIAGSYPMPLSQLSPLAPILASRSERYPGAELLARELITLPTHSRLTPADLQSLEGLLTALA